MALPPKPPTPQVGDYYMTRKPPTTIRAKAYVDPPSARRTGLQSVWTYPCGSIIGPVHEVEVSKYYVTVRVPDPCDWGRLVWVNVTFRKDAALYDVQFATRVPQWVVRDWVSQGWSHPWVYVPGVYLSWHLHDGPGVGDLPDQAEHDGDTEGFLLIMDEIGGPPPSVGDHGSVAPSSSAGDRGSAGL